MPATGAAWADLVDVLAQVREIADHAPAAVFVKDENGRYLFANRWLRQLLGIRADEVLGRTVSDVLPDALARRTEEHDRRVVAGQEVESEETVPTPSGDRVLMVVRFPFPLGGGPVGIFGIAVDVTDRRRAEAAALESARRAEEGLREQLALRDQLAKIAQSVPGVVCSFRQRPDGTACMPFSAPAIADLYGIPQDELARDMGPVFARMPSEDAQRVTDEIGASLRTMSRWHSEFRYEHPTKGLRWLEGTSIPMLEPDGSVLWHGYVSDVTERRRAEAALRETNEQLREAARQKDRFLGMLSHELRNPLAPIRNALFLLDRVDPASPQAQRAKDIAKRQVAHLTRLVDDLLDVTRIARGKIDLRRAKLDVAALARRVAEDHRPVMRERGLELTVATGSEPAVVDGDETRLAQAIGNLLNNAAKFTPAGGRVSVAVAAADGRAVIRVGDTGPGIPPTLLGSIFDAFTQADQTLARTEGGLGLGLALVKGIVALHGGDVYASNAEGGRGAEFTVTLPLA